MPRSAPTFRQTDLTKACKGVLAAGLKPTAAEILRDGRIVVRFGIEGRDGQHQPDVVEPDPAVLFDNWKAGR